MQFGDSRNSSEADPGCRSHLQYLNLPKGTKTHRSRHHKKSRITHNCDLWGKFCSLCKWTNHTLNKCCYCSFGIVLCSTRPLHAINNSPASTVWWMNSAWRGCFTHYLWWIYQAETARKMSVGQHQTFRERRKTPFDSCEYLAEQKNTFPLRIGTDTFPTKTTYQRSVRRSGFFCSWFQIPDVGNPPCDMFHRVYIDQQIAHVYGNFNTHLQSESESQGNNWTCWGSLLSKVSFMAVSSPIAARSSQVANSWMRVWLKATKVQHSTSRCLLWNSSPKEGTVNSSNFSSEKSIQKTRATPWVSCMRLFESTQNGPAIAQKVWSFWNRDKIHK